MGRRFVEARHAVLHSGHEHPLQPAAALDGRNDAVAIAPHAALARHGPDATENDALHAADVPVPTLQLFLEAGALLDRAKPSEHRADEVDKNQCAGCAAAFGLDAGAKKEKITAARTRRSTINSQPSPSRCLRHPKRLWKNSWNFWAFPPPSKNTPWRRASCSM